jgi:hypothetical protein
MKRLLFALFLIPCFVKAQDTVAIPKLPVDSATHLITYQEVVEAPKINKNDLYTRGRQWFAESFKSANSVLQMDDKESGKLIGRTVFTRSYIIPAGFGMTVPQEFTVYYTINLSLKDEKFRTVVSNFRVASAPGQDSPAENLRASIEAFSAKMPMVSKKMKKAFQSNMADVMLGIDNTGRACLKEIKQALLNPKKDDF